MITKYNTGDRCTAEVPVLIVSAESTSSGIVYQVVVQGLDGEVLLCVPETLLTEATPLKK